MRINPVQHGNNNNIYLTARSMGYSIRMIAFFNSGNTYIIKCKRKTEVPHLNRNLLYENLKNALDTQLDFTLVTHRNQMYINPPEFKSTQEILEKYPDES